MNEEGYIKCKICDGRGWIENSYRGKKFNSYLCFKCLGWGKIKWIEDLLETKNLK